MATIRVPSAAGLPYAAVTAIIPMVADATAGLARWRFLDSASLGQSKHEIQFLGAAREVTGSQYCLCCDGTKVLVDCGMFQEREFLYRNWEDCPVRPRESTSSCSPTRTSTIAACCRGWCRTAFAARSSRRAPRPTWPSWCSAIRPRFRRKTRVQKEAASQGRPQGEIPRKAALHDARRRTDAAPPEAGPLRPAAADQRQTCRPCFTTPDTSSARRWSS